MTPSHVRPLPATDASNAPDLPPAVPRLALADAVGPDPAASTARGERTRQRLVGSAAACFAEYGYTGTRIADVVHRAGTSQGTFYRHFTGKGDALLAAIRPVVAELLEASRRPGGDASSGPVPERAALVAASTAYLDVYARHRHLMRVTREASSIRDGSGFPEHWLAVRELFSSRTARWLEGLQRSGRGRPGDPALLAEVLGSTTEQVAYVHVGLAAATPRPERLRQLGEVLGDVWWRAVYRDDPGEAA